MNSYPIQNNRPMSSTINQGFDIYQKLLQALAMPEMMKTQQETAKADLDYKNIINQFLPKTQQANLDEKAAQIPYTQALTGETNERTKLMPVNSLISAQNAATQRATADRLQNTKGPAWLAMQQLSKKSAGDRAAWIADNPKLYNNILQTSMEEAQKQANAGSLNIPNYLNSDLLKTLGINQTAPKNSPSNPNQNPITPQNSGTPPNAIAPRPSPAPIVGGNLPQAPNNNNLAINPDDLNKGMAQLSKYPDVNPGEPGNTESQSPQVTIGDPSSMKSWTPEQRGTWFEMDAANRAATGPQIQNRKEAAIAFTNVIRSPQIQEALVKLSDPKYSGLIGKSDRYIKSRLNPSEVAEYNSISERIHTLLSGSLKQLEAIPTSNLGMERSADFFKAIANEKAWKRDPQAQLKDYITAMALADAESKAVIDSSQRVYQTYKFPEGTPPILEKSLKEAQQKENGGKVLEMSGIKGSPDKFNIESKTDSDGRVLLRINGKSWRYQDELPKG